MVQFDLIKQTDPEVAAAMENELVRQQEHLELIASENFASEAVIAAMGSHLTNKYAEGLPGNRYYGGCEYADVIETLAIERAKELFQAEHANVQPHSGSTANLTVYFALLNAGDTIMGMDLSDGGHLTHGCPANLSGKYYNVVSYGVSRETETIDYDRFASLARENRPKLIVAGASAYPRFIDYEYMSKVAKEVGAYFVVDIAHIAGLIAAGAHPSPVPFADVVTSTTHKTLRGPRGGLILCKQEFARRIDKAVFPGTQGGPLMHIIAAKAVCLKEANSPEYRQYQYQIVKNASALAQELSRLGIRIISGGTDNHLLLMDVTTMGITGKDAEKLLARANITVNKNVIPFDPLPATVTSGVRIGTPAVTVRGLDEEDMKKVAEIIADVLKDGEEAVERAKREVKILTGRHPLYENIK